MGTLTTAQVRDRSNRAQSRQIQYDQNGSDPHGQSDGSWRADCSGLVSAVFQLPQPGPNTGGLLDFVTEIPRAQVVPYACIVLTTAADGTGHPFGHTAVVVGYNSQTDQLVIQEHGGGVGPDIRTLPAGMAYDSVAKYGGYRPFKLYRMRNVTGDGVSTSQPQAGPGSYTTGPAETVAPPKPLPPIRRLPAAPVTRLTGRSGLDTSGRLELVRVKGRGLTADVQQAVLTASMSYATGQVGQLSLTIQDTEEAAIFRSNIFSKGAAVDFADQHMDVRTITLAGSDAAPVLSVASRSRVISALKGPKQSGTGSWGSVPVDQWVRDRAREVGARTIVQPLGRQTITRQESTQVETTWDVMQRLAGVLGAVCFEFDQTIVMAKPSWLINRPGKRGWPISWHSQRDYSDNLGGAPGYSDSYDGDTPEQLTFQLLGDDAFRCRPGDVVPFSTTGPWAGFWLVDSVTEDLQRGVGVAVTCGRATNPIPVSSE